MFNKLLSRRKTLTVTSRRMFHKNISKRFGRRIVYFTPDNLLNKVRTIDGDLVKPFENVKLCNAFVTPKILKMITFTKTLGIILVLGNLLVLACDSLPYLVLLGIVTVTGAVYTRPLQHVHYNDSYTYIQAPSNYEMFVSLHNHRHGSFLTWPKIRIDNNTMDKLSNIGYINSDICHQLFIEKISELNPDKSDGAIGQVYSKLCSYDVPYLLYNSLILIGLLYCVNTSSLSPLSFIIVFSTFIRIRYFSPILFRKEQYWFQILSKNLSRESKIIIPRPTITNIHHEY